MVTLRQAQGPVRSRAWRIAAAVPDPEVPVLTIEDLGMLRAVEADGDRVRVDITPTYSGCPAMDTIRDDVIMSLTAAGFAEVDVRFVLSPAWTTDWMTDAGKQKLEAYGIAPPSGRAATGSLRLSKGGPIRLAISVRCPRCGSLDTHEVSRFGSTSCKSLFECRACLEPFDHFKVH
ncbi:1,2-phenylacetyl-CoA epoxidase subunit PaaD [Microbacterium sp. LBN7]|uniref:1,2-phenylacetyl-CoA epoxidase subunit PaaD n=1 Tax=Microbacterium sp. LBN7 TaxID=3129773 RepID=UPI0032478D62